MAKKQYSVVVIGGGASGMTAAIAALEEAKAQNAGKLSGALGAMAEVLLLESNDRIGKKILATGNGKCNFTHSNVSAEHYDTDDIAALEKILSKYPTKVILDFFEKLGMLSREKNGYFYPLSETASTALDVLRLRLAELGCEISCGVYIEKIEKTGQGFSVQWKEQEKSYRAYADSVILATGSKAGGFLQNREEDPLRLAKSLGLSSTKLYPSLVKCICREDFYYGQLAGVRAQTELTLFCEKKGLSGKQKGDNNTCRDVSEGMTGHTGKYWKFLRREAGELQLTKEGISGIAVFQLSGEIAQKLSEKKRVVVEINFLPGFSEETLKQWAIRRLALLPGRNLEDFFLGVLHKKVLNVCLLAEGLKGSLRIPSGYTDGNLAENMERQKESHNRGVQCSDEKRALMMVLSVMKRAMHFTTEVTAVSDMKQAQVCRGGLILSQFDKRLECKELPGFFACGEVLNVNGECGGYNLHFAWSSGHLAGRAAMRRALRIGASHPIPDGKGRRSLPRL